MLMDVLIFDSRNSVIDLLELLTILDCLVSLPFSSLLSVCCISHYSFGFLFS